MENKYTKELNNLTNKLQNLNISAQKLNEENNNNIKNYKPIKLNFKNIRNERQKLNNILVYECIKTSNDEELNNIINNKELERILDETNLKRKELLNKCEKDNILCKILSGRISKRASRQGIKDEVYQLKICNFVAKKNGINIINLAPTAYRPSKDGHIISIIDMKNKHIKKDMCLKSFDAKITGNITGYIFAKVVFGSGGHQDNVFIEIDCMCDWVSKFKQNDSNLFVILIDTDLNDKLEIIKKKYKTTKNLLIVNHFSFQEYLINRYYEERT